VASDSPTGPGPQQGDVDVPNPDAGILFRAEMFMMNVVLGYAKVLLGVLVVVLIGALVIGQYQSWYRQNQRMTSSQVSDVERGLRAELLEGLDPMTRQAAENFTTGAVDLLPAVQELDEESVASVRTAADELVAIGAEARGPAASEAYLRAGELYRRVGDGEKRRAALEAAAEHASGVIAYVAVAGLASMDVDDGRIEAAASRLRALMDEEDGFPAQQAARQLASVYEHDGQAAEAKAVYDAYEARWPEAPDLADVQASRSKLQTGEG
jgi:hypothetical protein